MPLTLYMCSLLLDAYTVEDKLHILEVVLQCEASVELLTRKHCHNLWTLGQKLLVVSLLAHSTHRNRLNGIVSLLTRETSLDKGVHNALSEDNLTSAVDVLHHHILEYYEVLQDATEAVEHIVKKHSCVWKDDTLSS